MAKKSTMWRDFSIGVFSSIVASIVVSVIFESRISSLKAEIKQLKEQ